jgi:hypothetical protein
MSPTKNITRYSDPRRVQYLAHKLIGRGATVYLSTRKDKKYMIEDPATGHMVHFGQLPYEDFTKHKDKDRREAFLVRNAKWKHAPVYTPRWLAYHLLW